MKHQIKTKNCFSLLIALMLLAKKIAGLCVSTLDSTLALIALIVSPRVHDLTAMDTA